MFLFDYERVWDGSDIAITLTKKQRAILLLFASAVAENPELFLLDYPLLDAEEINDWTSSLNYALMDEIAVPTLQKYQDYIIVNHSAMTFDAGSPRAFENTNAQGGLTLQTPGTSGDKWYYPQPFYFRKGTWQYTAVGYGGSGNAKLDLKLMNVAETTTYVNILSQLDFYNATPNQNAIITTSFVLTSDVTARLRGAVNGRNAAATGWQIRLGWHSFLRTGD